MPNGGATLSRRPSPNKYLATGRTAENSVEPRARVADGNAVGYPGAFVPRADQVAIEIEFAPSVGHGGVSGFRYCHDARAANMLICIDIRGRSTFGQVARQPAGAFEAPVGIQRRCPWLK